MGMEVMDFGVGDGGAICSLMNNDACVHATSWSSFKPLRLFCMDWAGGKDLMTVRSDVSCWGMGPVKYNIHRRPQSSSSFLLLVEVQHTIYTYFSWLERTRSSRISRAR